MAYTYNKFNRDETPPLRGEVRQHRRLQDGRLGNAKMAVQVVSGGPRTYASTTDPRSVYRSLYINRSRQRDLPGLPRFTQVFAFPDSPIRRLTHRTRPSPATRPHAPLVFFFSQVRACTALAGAGFIVAS